MSRGDNKVQEHLVMFSIKISYIGCVGVTN